MASSTLAVVKAIGKGKGIDNVLALPTAQIAGAAEAGVAGDDVAHFSGLGEFTVVEVLASAGPHRRSPRG